MPMPETTVDQHNCAVPRKHNVGSSRQFLWMQPVSQSGSMETAPQLQLRLRVLASYAAHIEPPLLAGKYVGQGPPPLPDASNAIAHSDNCCRTTILHEIAASVGITVVNLP